jgi:hypothetical protein
MTEEEKQSNQRLEEEHLQPDHDPYSTPADGSSESLAETPIQNIHHQEAMEVHHHAHHEHGKKNWKSYFWEFLMLFLAVFCGFLAEYQLEHKIEKERGKQFIASLIADLKDDTLVISKRIMQVEEGIRLFDTLSQLMEDPAAARTNGEAIYYTARMGVRYSPLVNNTRTIDQLRNAGGFRLIHKQTVSDRIMKYYSSFPELRMVEEFFSKENTAFKEVASKVMNQAVYRKQVRPDNTIERIPGNLALLTYDPVTLNQLGFYAVQMNGSRRGILVNLRTLKQEAAELLNYLQQEYDLE